MNDITRLLRAWGSGDEAAFAQLMPLVYDEIHRLARRYMAHEQSQHGLQTTALVHEVYMRLLDVKDVDWHDRSHFYGLCARLMRRVLVDFARTRNFQKREGHFAHIGLDDTEAQALTTGPELVEVDDALRKLAAIDARKSDVVELRFFGGLTIDEIAKLLEISPETVMRDWKMAKAWLLRELGDEESA